MKKRCEKLKKNGTQCKNYAVEGSTLCRFHLDSSEQTSGDITQQAQDEPPIDYEALARVCYFALGVGITFPVFYFLQETADADFLKSYGKHPILHFIFGIALPLLLFLMRNSSYTHNVETLSQVHRSPILHITQSRIYNVHQIEAGPNPYLTISLAFFLAISYPIIIWTFVNGGASSSAKVLASLMIFGTLGLAFIIGVFSRNTGRYASTSVATISTAFIFWVAACLR